MKENSGCAEGSEMEYGRERVTEQEDETRGRVMATTDMSSASSNGRDRKLSPVLVAGLLVCCLLPIIILVAGVGITSYFLFRGSYLMFIFSIFILALVVIAFVFNNRSVSSSRNNNRLKKEQTAETDQEKEKGASTPASLANPEHCSGDELKPN
ncbi:MAG: hypothetical protein JRN20_19900 [Nitrososphaerota archaeon]|nr:hypothetical protein [Nitrososphaerota archaeon]